MWKGVTRAIYSSNQWHQSCHASCHRAESVMNLGALWKPALVRTPEMGVLGRLEHPLLRKSSECTITELVTRWEKSVNYFRFCLQKFLRFILNSDCQLALTSGPQWRMCCKYFRKYAIWSSSGWSVEYCCDFSWLGALLVINFWSFLKMLS